MLASSVGYVGALEARLSLGAMAKRTFEWLHEGCLGDSLAGLGVFRVRLLPRAGGVGQIRCAGAH